MTVKIKADIETPMHLKAIRILTLIIFIIIASCSEETNQDNHHNIQDNTTKTEYDFVYNEPCVLYSIVGCYNAETVKKNIMKDNITLYFDNVRNEEVYLLIPESDENKKDGVSFIISNAETKCSPLANCTITFNMLIKEQSPLNSNFTVYLPVALLNQQEMTTFINMNSEEKYKPFAMKYLTNRIYIKFKITGTVDISKNFVYQSF